jgi:hypothetical protein
VYSEESNGLGAVTYPEQSNVPGAVCSEQSNGLGAIIRTGKAYCFGYVINSANTHIGYLK